MGSSTKSAQSDRKSWFLILLCLVLLAGPAQAGGQGAPRSEGKVEEKTTTASVDEEGEKATAVVRKMLAAVRLQKFDHALRYVGLAEMARYLLDKHHKDFAEAQLQRFQRLLGEYIKKRGFPLANKYIGRVGLSYDKAVMKDERIHVRSSIVYSGSERLVFTWILKKGESEYQVVDFLDVDGNSSLKKSRDEQILPTYRKRGAKGLLDTLERTVKSLK